MSIIFKEICIHEEMLLIYIYIYIYIYNIEECIFTQQVIKASFIKDDGTMFIICNCTFSSLVGIQVVKDHDTRKITRRLEKLQIKMINSFLSSLIKLA